MGNAVELGVGGQAAVGSEATAAEASGLQAVGVGGAEAAGGAVLGVGGGEEEGEASNSEGLVHLNFISLIL